MAEQPDDLRTDDQAADGRPVDERVDRGQVSGRALPSVPPHVGRDLGLYVLVRLALVAVVAVVLTLVNVPLLVSIAVGLVIGLPLSMVVLRGWHERVSAGLAARGMARRAQRDALRAELRGEPGTGTATPDAG